MLQTMVELSRNCVELTTTASLGIGIRSVNLSLMRVAD